MIIEGENLLKNIFEIIRLEKNEMLKEHVDSIKKLKEGYIKNFKTTNNLSIDEVVKYAKYSDLSFNDVIDVIKTIESKEKI